MMMMATPTFVSPTKFATPPVVHKFTWGTEGTPRRSKRIKTAGARSPVRQPSTIQSRKSSRALDVLRQSNRMLEHIISERRQHEALLESQLFEAQQSLRRSKDMQLRETVKSISSSLFVLAVLALLGGLYRMFSPHFDSIIMAGLVALLLKGDVQALGLRLVTRVQLHVRSVSHLVLVGANACLLAAALVAGTSVQLAVGLLLAFEAALLFADGAAVVAGVLTFLVSALLCVPLFLVLKMSVTEVDGFVKLAMRLLEDKTELANLYARVSRGPAQGLVLALEQIGALELSPDLVGDRLRALGAANSEMALGALKNVSNVAWACGVFASTLFWLLHLDFYSLWEGLELAKLSPLLPQDNADMLFAVRQGSLEVFLGSALVGMVHGAVTGATLTAVGSPLIVVPAALSCMLAVAPLLGSFIIWTPFVVALLALNRVSEAATMAFLELFTMLVIEPWIVSRFPTSGKFFGLPIVCGLFAFGPCGVVFGPLVIALSVTTAKIFHRYVSTSASTFAEDFTTIEEEENNTFSVSFSTHHNSPVPRPPPKSPALSTRGSTKSPAAWAAKSPAR